RQAFNTPHDPGTDHNLVGVHSADQHQVGILVGGKEVIDGPSHQQHTQEHEKSVSLTQWFLFLTVLGLYLGRARTTLPRRNQVPRRAARRFAPGKWDRPGSGSSPVAPAD